MHFFQSGSISFWDYIKFPVYVTTSPITDMISSSRELSPFFFFGLKLSETIFKPQFARLILLISSVHHY